jgi:hypothetical protein
MREKIGQGKRRALCGRRMQIMEPCFADITYNKKMNRFSLRTKIKVNIQWLLYCMVHNIGKCVPGILAESGGQEGRAEGGFAKGREQRACRQVNR